MLDVAHAWNDFYSQPSSPASNLPKNRYTSSQTPTQGSSYVYCCFFASCSASKGGGILVSTETKMLIEETSFSSCQATSGSGGGMFFSATGCCILYRVCSFKSKASSEGHFIYTTLPQSTVYNNTMKYCSVSWTENSAVQSSACLLYGKILVSSVNSSFNKCEYFSGIKVRVFSSLYSDCVISYSCFSNNEEKSGVNCIFYSGSGYSEMRSCNVINNKQTGTNSGTIYVDYYLNIYDSCIIDNEAPYIISIGSGGDANFYNTTFDKTFKNGGVIKSTAKSSFKNKLNFIKTAECDAESIKTFTSRKYQTHKHRLINIVDIIKLTFMNIMK